MVEKLSSVTIYCDGSCLGNPGPGGYAALLIHKKEKINEKVIAGSEKNSTNNRMELMAAIVGIRALKRKCQIDLYSDSKYLIRGMTEWIKTWQKNGFKNSQNKAIANQDLWEDLYLLASKHELNWHWVKGHVGNEFNERVDEIAREQALLITHKKIVD